MLKDPYACAIFVGHDEYWASAMRDTVDSFVDAGGHVARFGADKPEDLQRPGILLLMSYDLAVWEGPQPTTGADADSTFERLFSEYVEDDRPTEPVASVAAFVEALLARWPEDSEDSPYSAHIFASGSIAYITLSYSRAGEVTLYSAELAARFGLVCFDPQTGWSRPDAGGEPADHGRR
ncbi:hypothetical protein Q0Z83_040720 [Actinoplanes sichuanensis]|uniref:N,N-dimethylformamidase beta subunit family domain-containing protein n=1 Tax=Actinoplanes sichuanensis TaxID=512349 RepID=A0ABW4A3N1_9ACTN|nr:N,N-dimethylformamidase beta subunit family domain-containing protein [Actinoplanes sichuanensis]BEL05881.1 hypothetical protein Q0Z83_040720 [Actinoplanes sichuanensis]